MKSKVFVLGSLNMDYNFSLCRLPKRGETITTDDFFVLPGGKGANQAVALAKQDVETFMLGSVGDDKIGVDLIETLNHYQVDTSYIEKIKDCSSGLAGIIIENNDNRILVHPGANHKHNTSKINKILNEVASDNDWLLTQFEIPMDVISSALKTAKENHMTTIVNPSPYQTMDTDLIHLIDYLIVNQSEAEAIIGHSIENVEDAMSEIVQKGFKKIIMTMGKEGSYFFDGKNIKYQNIMKTKAVDTTGAGDAFTGCFLASLINNDSVDIALKKATICSSITIETKGVQNAIPNKKMIEKRMKGLKK